MIELFSCGVGKGYEFEIFYTTVYSSINLGWFSEKKDTSSKVLDDATEYLCLIIAELVAR